MLIKDKNLNEDELNALIAHAHKKVDQLRQQLVEQQVVFLHILNQTSQNATRRKNTATSRKTKHLFLSIRHAIFLRI